MPYISTEEVKEIRNNLKEKFPQIKFSVRRLHHSKVMVVAKSGSVFKEFNGLYEDVNPFHPNHNFSKSESLEIAKDILSIISKKEYIVVHDADYGAVPNFYYDFSIGDWDKPYKYVGE